LAHDGTADSVCPLPRDGVPATLSVAGCPWRGRVGEGVARPPKSLSHAPSLSLPRKRGRVRTEPAETVITPAR